MISNRNRVGPRVRPRAEPLSVRTWAKSILNGFRKTKAADLDKSNHLSIEGLNDEDERRYGYLKLSKRNQCIVELGGEQIDNNKEDK